MPKVWNPTGDASNRLVLGGKGRSEGGPMWNLHLWHSETLQNIAEEIRPLLASWKMVYWNYLLHRLSLKKKEFVRNLDNWIFIGYLLEDICSWSFIQGDSRRKLSKFPGQQSKDVHPTFGRVAKKSLFPNDFRWSFSNNFLILNFNQNLDQLNWLYWNTEYILEFDRILLSDGTKTFTVHICI